MELNFNTLKTVENLKSELLKAYLKQAKIVSEKLDLEKKLEAINAKLEANTEVAKVLAHRKYNSIKDLTTDKKFLKDVEAEAVAQYKKLKKLKGKVKPLSVEKKVEHLVEIFKANKNKAMTTAQLKAKLLEKKALAAGGNLQQWLKALNLPEEAVTALGARKDGSSYDPAHIPQIQAANKK